MIGKKSRRQLVGFLQQVRWLNAFYTKWKWRERKVSYGKENADKALEAAKAVFGAGSHSENMPSTDLKAEDLVDGKIAVIDLLTKCGLAPSKGEARRLVQQGGVSVDDQKVTDVAQTISKEDFEKGYVILRKGKKVYHKAQLI